jgi:hypothetical protein
METPPKMLNGAVVLHYVILSSRYRSTGAIKIFIDGHEMVLPLALVICQYAGEERAYLFYCGADWNVMNDDLCDSVSDAFRQAERQFEGLTEAEWSAVEDSAHQLEIAQCEKVAALAALPDDYATDDTIRRLVSEGQDLEAIARLQRVRGQSLFEAYSFIKAVKQMIRSGRAS